ncbi:bifunctional serine/threonine-protein kinase/ABC transporter substrate-binding protein [Streptomyces roseicoloratus]|uniref:Bifunctional serine/threonine-protein kinase/ABC transporter substrate-binding protein n=1 Tax=Streptomyces roseicoloratus TaxID=2508722 RepID=A0ABY9RTS0_9ACTN|nr:bifunctional serine/threonine-protein kinase/ABC transporter substrate-binding protein [Streptomyces roseicoloratus]WMX45588.1 bifunctional serine/threonine-protein kinase/ABC transporter substrate-binding protein [Streptomyces roseicoloratus]
MQPLRKADPSTIAGYRLLGRLGAGGMGVVYLARTAGGALAALKLIRAEHAADPGFRARFRREAATAERITGRWVVRVLGADPEAREPWLATEFVPGPSLVEAVDAHGALPEPAVRALGARLADALHDMHEAGLVHRDVKPGNVLLALDGPRLIDFGIARVTGATALTATDAMIGTPGFLAPEQARALGAGEVGPASDVFSLGCVLAYALTGRRPFGTGGVAAVVYRTVHEEPDLDGLPDSLLPLVTACLAKDAADRPTAAEVRAALGPASGPAGDWLPPGLPALIARRSSRVLDLPVADPTRLDPAPPPGTSRRRLLVLGSAGAVAAAGGLTAWLFGRDPATGTGGATGAPRAAYTLGMVTDLSGPGKTDGRAQERGLRLAAETFNARSDRPFDLVPKVRDDGGDPRRSTTAARALLQDRALVAVLGPTTTETAMATAEVMGPAKVTVMSLVASVPAGVVRGGSTDPRTYYELRPHPDTLIVPFARYLSEHRLGRTAVVHDRAGGTYSWSAVRSMKNSPPAGGTVTSHEVAADSEDFGPAVRAALATSPQGVMYAGTSPRRAALCARALKEQGFRGPCGSVEYALEPEFLTVAGAAAEGWYFGVGYTDPDTVPAAKEFAAAYRERYGLTATDRVDRFAVETYDTLFWLGQALRTAIGRNAGVTGAAVANALMVTDMLYKGVARSYNARANDTSTSALEGLTLWQIRSAKPRCLGPFAEAAQR